MKQKTTREFINDKNIDIYAIHIPSEYISYDRSFWNDSNSNINKDRMGNYDNITANKAESPRETWLGLVKNSVDNKCNYETFIFYPLISPNSDYKTLVGVQRPKNRLYPTFLEFQSMGYTSLIVGAKSLANKNGFSFSSTLKPFIINQSSAFIAKQLAKQDKYYLDVNDLTIKDKTTDTPITLPDESIFKPLQTLYSHEWHRTNIWRKWADIKYYGTQLKSPKYVHNQAKYEAYLKTLIGAEEEIISCEPININTTPKEDYIRYILQTALTTYYQDLNDDLIFTIKDKQYKLDFDLEEIRDIDNNLIDMIDVFPHTVITTEDYSTLLKKFITIEQTMLVEEILKRLNAGNYDFQGIYFPQSQPYNFTKGQVFTCDYSKENVLTYDSKEKGLIPTDSTEIQAIQENYPLVEYDDGVMSFNRDRSAKELQRLTMQQASLLLFNVITNTKDIEVDSSKNPNLQKYYIYLYEKYKSNKDYNETETIDLQPILVVDNVTSMNSIVMKTYTSRWTKTYIDKSEKNNYAEVYQDALGNYYTYLNTSTKLDTPEIENNYIIEKEDGSIETTTKERLYSDTPIQSTSLVNFIQDLIKFTLPNRIITLDNRAKKLITAFKANEISGYFLKYKDIKGRTKIKIIGQDRQEFLNNTCDIENNFINIMPIVPFYSVLDVVVPTKTKSHHLSLWLGGLGAKGNYQYFYYIYDKKVLNYYRKAFNFDLKIWQRALMGYQYIDKEYGVKTKKKVSKVFTDRNHKMYRGGFLENGSVSTGNNYDTYYQSDKHGYYGFHTSVRFTFAIFFNKYIRRTKLLNKMAIEYLEFYFKNFNGILNQEFIMYVYPNDRIQYIEKRLLLCFTKKELTEQQVANLKAIYYSVFDYNKGLLIFYDKRNKVSYELNINKLYPVWKQSFFENRIFNKTSNKYDYMTIKKEDIVPLKYTDILPSNIEPLDVYTKNKANRYELNLSSYFFNLPIKVVFHTKEGVKTRTINFWKNAVDYRVFYMPYDISAYNSYYKADLLENFQERNVITYLTNWFNNKSTTEIEIYYKLVLGKDIKIEKDAENIFDYNKMFSNGFLTKPTSIDFSQRNENEIIQNTPELNLQASYQGEMRVNLELFQTQALYETFKTSNLLVSYVSKKDCISEIVDKLFLDELPMNKYITERDFKAYFINYDKNSKLAQIFTDREIYEIGFRNYLVTDDVDSLEDISMLLPKIYEKISNFIVKFDLNNNNIQLANYWLPLPIDAYKKFPFYSKKFVSTYFATTEAYIVRSIPCVDADIKHDNKIFGIVMAVLGVIVAIICFVGAAFTGGESVAGGIAIIGSMMAMFSSIINLVILFLPPDIAAGLQKLSKIFAITGAVFSSISGIGSLTSGLNSLQIANIVITSINFTLELASEVVKLVYEKKMEKDNNRLNEKKEELNESVDELWKFLEANEFNEALEMINPINSDYWVQKKFNDNYDEFYEKYIDNSLSLLYTELEYYYDKRIDE